LKFQDLEFCGAYDLLTKVSNQLHLTVIAVGRQNPMMSPPQRILNVDFPLAAGVTIQSCAYPTEHSCRAQEEPLYYILSLTMWNS